MQSSKPKIALFFGSFDPVHNGHLIIAQHILNQYPIQQVWFVITPQNPFKVTQYQTPQHLRKEMLEIALADSDDFKVCDIEFGMSPPHYTYKTLLSLQERYPDNEFTLLIGGDNLQSLDKWKNYKEILNLIPLYVYPRLGFSSSSFDDYSSVFKTNAPIIEISSTQIRKNLAEGISARFLVPQGVLEYILENRIYASPNSFLTAST